MVSSVELSGFAMLLLLFRSFTQFFKQETGDGLAETLTLNEL